MSARDTASRIAAAPAALPRFLEDEWQGLSHYERIEVIRELGALSRPGSLEVLAEMFRRLDSAVYQAQILSSVDAGGAAGEGPPEFFREALSHPNARVRANAVEALGPLRSEALDGRIREMLSDDDNRVRANACIYLWRHGQAREEVRETLEGMFGSNDPWVRASAVFAAGSILDPAFDPLLRSTLGDEYEPSVAGAVRALTARRDPGLLERVVGMLASPEASTALWHAAADAVLELPGPAPAGTGEALLHALAGTGDRELQDKLLAALARNAGDDTPGQILDLFEDQDVDFHLCHRLLEIVGQAGRVRDRDRLEQLSKGRLSLYADIIARAREEISRRHRRWW